MQTINERITLIKIANNMKQKEFSELIGIPRSSLSEIESGKRSASLDVIVGISTHFKEINIDWLLTGEGGMYRAPKDESDVTDKQGEKVLALYGALNDSQRKEILFAIEEKQQLNQLMETVQQLKLKVG